MVEKANAGVVTIYYPTDPQIVALTDQCFTNFDNLQGDPLRG